MAPILELCNAELCAFAELSERMLIKIQERLRNWSQMLSHHRLSTKLRLEQAKQRFDMYYTIRHLAPEFFTDRDPPGLRITCLRSTMYSFMMFDILMTEDRSSGMVAIFDLALMNLSYMMKFTPAVIKKCLIVPTKAYGARVEGIDFLNAPPFIDRFVAILKSVMKSKLAARVYVHLRSNSETLYKFVPKSILPKAYGGNEPSMDAFADAPDEKLDWFILSTKMSLEQAKQRLDMYYTIRRLVPEIFANRDPRGPGIATANILQLVHLPKPTPDKYRVIIGRNTKNESSTDFAWECMKYAFMVLDLVLLEDRTHGTIIIIDLAMVGLGHLMKFTPTVIKKCEIITTKAYGSRLKGIHFINSPSYVNQFITLLKSALKQKLAERVHSHTAGNLESLYKFVPKSSLPKDYGGDQPSMEVLDSWFRQRLDHHRDWFLKSEKTLVDERLRPGPAIDEDSLFGFSGSFRKLEVD